MFNYDDMVKRIREVGEREEEEELFFIMVTSEKREGEAEVEEGRERERGMVGEEDGGRGGHRKRWVKG